MAVKDHSLDDKIIQAAKAEFLEYGFQKASLHKIAGRAGITTGALYTRYKNKDALFCSLIEPAMADMMQQAQPIAQMYEKVQSKDDLPLFLAAMQEETRVYLDILFRYYDACVLLFCKSAGSSVERTMNAVMEQKAQGTVEFLEHLSHKKIDGIEFIMREQFSFFSLILEKGYGIEKTIACLRTFEEFNEAGWKHLFEAWL